MMHVAEHDRRDIVFMCWIVALAATLGSLYFQYALGLPPCVLCWYQRIAMYPLSVFLGIAFFRKDIAVPVYALPLSLAGIAIGGYHNLLYYGILPESAAPCIEGVSCTTRQIEWAGFVTIPLLSLVAFLLITTGLFAYWKANRTTNAHAR